jgi:hypothetical protein
MLDNPVSKYPKPPFPRQQQPWPGLASKMSPRPDHGEDSYQGSCRLAGRKALITGGDSGMGGAAAIAFAREGADVAVNYFPSEEEDAREVMTLIDQAGRKGLALPGDLRNEAFCRKRVDDAAAGLGGLDILVCNAARQQAHKSILEISSEDFDATIKTNIYAPFWLIRAALPHMPPGSAIIGTTRNRQPILRPTFSTTRRPRLRPPIASARCRNSSPRAAFASTAWRPVRSGRPCRCPAARPWKS